VIMQTMRTTSHRDWAAFRCVPARPVTSIHLGTATLTVGEDWQLRGHKPDFREGKGEVVLCLTN
jgi:hypothetical protein